MLPVRQQNLKSNLLDILYTTAPPYMCDLIVPYSNA